MSRTILITGGAGFVGSNLAIFLKGYCKQDKIICFDSLVRRGSELNKVRLKEKGIDFIKGDIREKKAILKLKGIDFIIEACAEPSVLAAYEDPSYTVDTNLGGTINCLELARRENAGLIFLSTSRVFPIESMESIPFVEKDSRFDWKEDVQGQGFSYQGFNHEFPLSGIRSLYGATKLCSEMIIQEYADMFGIKSVINRFGIIAGPWQMGKIDQGLVGFWVAQHKYKQPLKYIGYNGEGKQVRDAIHVDDVCELILQQMERLDDLDGEVFTIGGGRGNSFSLQELTEQVQKITNSETKITHDQERRKSDIRIFIADNRYVQDRLSWSPKRNLETIIVDTSEWINKNDKKLQSILK